jgi:hypothetical protein
MEYFDRLCGFKEEAVDWQRTARRPAIQRQVTFRRASKLLALSLNQFGQFPVPLSLMPMTYLAHTLKN